MRHDHLATRRRRRPTSRRLVWVVGLAVFAMAAMVVGVSVVLGSGSGRRATPPVHQRPDAIAAGEIVLYGDSVTTQAGPYLAWLYRIDHPRGTLTIHSFAGTALCDWASRVVGVIRSRTAPAAVALEFAGNSFTTCMGGSSTRLGYLPGTAAYAHAYAAAMDRIRRAAAVAHVRTYWVEPPVLAPRTSGFDAVTAFDALARQRGFIVLRTADALADEHGHWVGALPCAPWETAAEGCSNGRIEVRDDEQLHFAIAPDGYSGGELRWALAVASLLP
jgi:hypothetical protein